MYAAVGAPGSTYDAEIVKESFFSANVLPGRVLPDFKFSLDDYGDIPLVTIGDGTFQKGSWLIKFYNENTNDKQQCYFNKMLYSAKVVSKNTYGMLKERFRFCTKTNSQPKNLYYVIMACIALHNICISENDLCQL